MNCEVLAMNFVKHLDLFGVEVKEIPCIPGRGAPTTTTVGAVGCLYMDTDTGNMYKCTAVADGVYIWIKEVTEATVEAIVADKISSITNAEEVAY